MISMESDRLAGGALAQGARAGTVGSAGKKPQQALSQIGISGWKGAPSGPGPTGLDQAERLVAVQPRPRLYSIGEAIRIRACPKGATDRRWRIRGVDLTPTGAPSSPLPRRCRPHGYALEVVSAFSAGPQIRKTLRLSSSTSRHRSKSAPQERPVLLTNLSSRLKRSSPRAVITRARVGARTARLRETSPGAAVLIPRRPLAVPDRDGLRPVTVGPNERGHPRRHRFTRPAAPP